MDGLRAMQAAMLDLEPADCWEPPSALDSLVGLVLIATDRSEDETEVADLVDAMVDAGSIRPAREHIRPARPAFPHLRVA